MTTEEIKKILAILGLLALSACGGGSAPAGGGSSLAVTILNAKSFSPNIEHGKIQTYRVEIAGDDIAAPIVAEFSGDAEDGVIENVPTGRDRAVKVEAVNGNDVTIRAGEVFNIEIGDGENSVDVELSSVPIFTNLANGASIDNMRLVFRLFSEPGHQLQVEETSGAADGVLSDVSTSSNQILADESSGLGRRSPPLISAGTHTFRVKDASTGRFSDVSVKLLDGTKSRPAPLAAAAGSSWNRAQKIGTLSGF